MEESPGAFPPRKKMPPEVPPSRSLSRPKSRFPRERGGSRAQRVLNTNDCGESPRGGLDHCKRELMWMQIYIIGCQKSTEPACFHPPPGGLQRTECPHCLYRNPFRPAPGTGGSLALNRQPSCPARHRSSQCVAAVIVSTGTGGDAGLDRAVWAEGIVGSEGQGMAFLYALPQHLPQTTLPAAWGFEHSLGLFMAVAGSVVLESPACRRRQSSHCAGKE